MRISDRLSNNFILLFNYSGIINTQTTDASNLNIWTMGNFLVAN